MNNNDVRRNLFIKQNGIANAIKLRETKYVHLN